MGKKESSKIKLEDLPESSRALLEKQLSGDYLRRWRNRVSETKDERRAAAQEAIGPIYPGCEVFLFTKGLYSLIDILAHLINEIEEDNIELAICTWSAGILDIEELAKFKNKISHIRFILDSSFPRRKAQHCAKLIETFGEDCIRVSVIHCKFWLMKAAEWRIVGRTSQNLNLNTRFENVEISDDPGLFSAFEELIAEIWSNQEPGLAFKASPYELKKGFQRTFPIQDPFESMDSFDWKGRAWN